MTPQRWSQIKEVFFRTRETREEERSAYLASACGDDRELRTQVELLLAKDDGPSLRRPAADLLDSVASQLAPGETVGQYRVEAKLGEGGMGAVYRAFDTRLRREVALKVLSEGHAADSESKQRLLREARAASALNHPNIVTVYEIGSEAGIDFIAMEFVEGKSLKELIPAKGLPLERVLDCAVQIASGLSKAHAAGIIHRDLKPGNIMLTSDGVVKLLDFGLARRVRQAESDTASLTAAGEIAGTPSYMSPEQTRGEELDVRSDLFSFGVVLYEMVTGKQAFSGTTSALIFDAILHQAPVSPVHLNPKCPLELERVINKALEKDADLRYQSSSEMSADLKRLKRDTESERALALLPKRESPTPFRFRSYTGRKAVALATIAVTVMVLGFAGLLWFSRSRPAAPEAALKAVPLTTYLGVQTDPTFSPDGSQVAFSWNGEKEGNFNIYVKLVGSEAPLRLTNDPADEYSPSWSPDGRWIAFWRDLSDTRYAVVLTTPIPGPERVLTENYRGTNLDGPLLSWSPDSHWLAMTNTEKPGERPAIFLFSLETGEKRSITSRPVGNWLGDSCPAFSPDGRKLAFSRWAAFASSEIYLLDLSADLKPIGVPKRVTFGDGQAETPAWAADGKSLIFGANWGPESCLWRLDVPGASRPQRLALLGHGIAEPATARRANRLAYVHYTGHAGIWRIPISPHQEGMTKPAKFIYSARDDELPQFSPDGRKIAFVSDRSGSVEIWICNGDGSDLVQLTSLGASFTSSPAWSPDSQRLAFSTNVEGQEEVYVVSSSGGRPRRLTFTTYASNPSWSNDGHWLLFDADLQRSRGSIYKVPAEGGQPMLVRPNAGFWGPKESPDGQFIYGVGADAVTLVRVPAAGGEVQSVVTLATAWDFVLAKGGVYFVAKRDPKSLQFLDATSGKTRRITSLDTAPRGLTVSPDGRWLLYHVFEQGPVNLMLVENFH